MRNGSINVAENPDREYAQKNVVYYRNIATDAPLSPQERETRLFQASETLRKHERVVRYATRFVIISDHEWIAAVDTKTGENRIFLIKEIDKTLRLLLALGGYGKGAICS